MKFIDSLELRPRGMGKLARIRKLLREKRFKMKDGDKMTTNEVLSQITQDIMKDHARKLNEWIAHGLRTAGIHDVIMYIDPAIKKRSKKPIDDHIVETW